MHQETGSRWAQIRRHLHHGRPASRTAGVPAARSAAFHTAARGDRRHPRSKARDKGRTGDSDNLQTRASKVWELSSFQQKRLSVASGLTAASGRAAASGLAAASGRAAASSGGARRTASPCLKPRRVDRKPPSRHRRPPPALARRRLRSGRLFQAADSPSQGTGCGTRGPTRNNTGEGESPESLSFFS